jgi:3-hydroxybutyryl-CoA dehydratase
MTQKLIVTYGTRSAEILIQRESNQTYAPKDQVSATIHIDDKLVRDYAGTYGDRNPIHLDEQAGRESIFKSRIAHGMLSFNFFSTLLGAGFPGPGTIFTGVENWRFTAPVRIDDELKMEVVVALARQKTNGAFELALDARATNREGVTVMAGRLNVIAPKP